jgi:hypothetical protein
MDNDRKIECMTLDDIETPEERKKETEEGKKRTYSNNDPVGKISLGTTTGRRSRGSFGISKNNLKLKTRLSGWAKKRDGKTTLETRVWIQDETSLNARETSPLTEVTEEDLKDRVKSEHRYGGHRNRAEKSQSQTYVDRRLRVDGNGEKTYTVAELRGYARKYRAEYRRNSGAEISQREALKRVSRLLRKDLAPTHEQWEILQGQYSEEEEDCSRIRSKGEKNKGERVDERTVDTPKDIYERDRVRNGGGFN